MTTSRTRLLLSWSSGKDSAWLLHRLRRSPELELTGLLTTVHAGTGRVAAHSTRGELLDLQVEATGLPVHKVVLPDPCPNEVYERQMEAALRDASADGVQAIAFGDLFLEDIRRYRETSLGATAVRPLFPLWGSDTRELAREMVDGGLRAVVVCVDPATLDASFAGRTFDRAFLDDLPADVDPCGERGEFHTFAFDGPMFRAPIPVQAGDRVERGGLVFVDLAPAGAPSRLVPEVGLCSICRHARTTRNARGSTFWRCAAAEWHADLPRYPPLPVTECFAHEPADDA